jgi:hypothetical protein
MIPVPTQQISCRLITTHAGYSGESTLLEELYAKGMALSEIAPGLRAGNSCLFTWRHECLAPWQTVDGLAEAWLLEQRHLTRPLQYLRQFENRFVNNAAAYITGEWFDHSIKKLTSRPGKLRIYVAVDAGWKRDNAAMVAVTVDGDYICFVYAKIFTPSPDDPLDFETTIEKTLLDLNERYTIRLCWVDPTQMEYMKQRMRKIGIPIEALTQNPENLTAATQTLYDLFRTERFVIPPNPNIDKLRDVVTRTLFTEKSGGLRLAKNQAIKTDLTTALAMACLAATQRSDKSGYRWDIWDDNFVDEDVKQTPPPELEPLRANADWWRGVSRAPSMASADDRLNDYYQQIAMGIQWGLIR